MILETIPHAVASPLTDILIIILTAIAGYLTRRQQEKSRTKREAPAKQPA